MLRVRTFRYLVLLALLVLSCLRTVVGAFYMNLGSIAAVKALVGQKGDVETALRWLEAAATRSRENAGAYRQIALLDYAQGDYADALAALHNISARKLERRDFRLLGDTYAALGDREAAIRNWASADAEDQFLEIGDLEMARDILQFKVQNNPDSLAMLLQLGEVLMGLNQPELAMSHLARAVHLHPASVLALYKLASAQNALGHWQDAAGTLEHLIRTVEVAAEGDLESLPTAARNFYHDSVLVLAYTYKTNGRPQLSMRYYRQAQALWPGDLTSYGHLADLYLASNQPDEALRQLEAIMEAGRVQDYAFRAGLIHLSIGQPERALEYFGEAIAAQPSRGALYAWMGDTLCQLNRQSEARQMYEKAKSLGVTTRVTCPR